MVSAMHERRKNERGFTLLELMIVVAILGILTAVAIPRFQQAPQKAKEAVLKTNLHTMREAFDQYFADKAAYPESLETLVEEGYLREVPIDPLTGSSSRWRLIVRRATGSAAAARTRRIATVIISSRYVRPRCRFPSRSPRSIIISWPP